MLELSEETRIRLVKLFPRDDWEEAEKILERECGDNLPFCEKSDPYQMERIRFAALKLSEGILGKLRKA